MLARLRQRLSPLGLYALWIAVVIYIFVQGSLHFEIAQGRTQPTELDDTFTYVWQAAHLAVCLPTCPAIATLTPTLQTPSDNVNLNNTRVDGSSRLLSVYAPLEIGLLLGIQRVTGLEWEDAYRIFMALGVILQAAAIGLLLRALWGDWPAALGLVSVAFSFYVGQGLYCPCQYHTVHCNDCLGSSHQRRTCCLAYFGHWCRPACFVTPDWSCV